MKTAITFLLILLAIMFFLMLMSKAGAAEERFVDSTVYKLYVREAPIGDFRTSLDESGRYERIFTLSMAGQSAEFTMMLEPDESGIWKRITIVNPSKGTVTVRNDGDKARIDEGGEEKTIDLPSEYTLYDDYGILFESVMLKKYDMEKKGKQTFRRFRFVETVGKNLLDVEVEYLGREKMEVGGAEIDFMKFDYEVMGVRATYWVDSDFRICLIDSPVEYAVGVREGYGEMLPFSPAAGKLAELKRKADVPMRDGVLLSTDLYFPDSGAEKHPVILIRTPYKKEMNELDGLYWARNGYVCAVQDVRGRFESKGEWEPFVNEKEDGYDTVEWLAHQDWCDGNVGMIGGSYLGWVQLQAASMKPPHLKAIIPNVAPPDPFFNIPYEYGSFYMLAALWWAEVVESEATGDISGKTMGRIQDREYEEIFKTLPVIDVDRKVFGRENRYWREWIKHNVNDDYWERANYLESLGELDIPVFLQSGWFDGDGIGTKLAYLALRESDNLNVKMIVGPWGHTDQATTQVYGNEVGEEAGIDLSSLYLRWMDYWLRGEENGIMDEPLVDLYTLNSKKWLKADSYPLPGTVFTPFYIDSDKGANTLKGDGRMSASGMPTGREYDRFTYNPGDPTPAPQFRYKKDGNKSYRKITEKRKDILVYRTGEFEDELTIAGPISFRLYASSSAADTDWFVSMQAEMPHGDLIPLCKGTIRARFRNSMSEPELLEKDEIYSYDIDMWHTGITLEEGSRLRLEVTSAYFPFFSRNLGTGGHNEMEKRYRKAKQKVYHSREFPSHLILPVVDPGDYTGQFVRSSEIEGRIGRPDPAAGAGKDPITGEYALRAGVVIRVWKEDGQYRIQGTGGPEEVMEHQSGKVFLVRRSNAELEFVEGEGGTAAYLLIKQGGYRFRARNLGLPAPEKPAVREKIEVDPLVLARYAGDYRLTDGAIFTVRVDGTKIFGQLTGQPEIEIFPESDTEFFYTIVDAQVVFEPGSDGSAPLMLLYQNGAVMELLKLE